MFIRERPGGARLLRCAHRVGGPWRLPENVSRNESQHAKKNPLRYTLAGPFRQGFRTRFRAARCDFDERKNMLNSRSILRRRSPHSHGPTQSRRARSFDGSLMALGGADSSHETAPESPPSTSRKSARSAGATSGRKKRSGLVVVTKTWLAVSFKNS